MKWDSVAECRDEINCLTKNLMESGKVMDFGLGLCEVQRREAKNLLALWVTEPGTSLDRVGVRDGGT
jgi:hypothetical protein